MGFFSCSNLSQFWFPLCCTYRYLKKIRYFPNSGLLKKGGRLKPTKKALFNEILFEFRVNLPFYTKLNYSMYYTLFEYLWRACRLL